ncbi:MAG: hypothetical protein ABSD96_03310 [Candidatus Korobacteraceae bacterium]
MQVICGRTCSSIGALLDRELVAHICGAAGGAIVGAVASLRFHVIALRIQATTCIVGS